MLKNISYKILIVSFLSLINLSNVGAFDFSSQLDTESFSSWFKTDLDSSNNLVSDEMSCKGWVLANSTTNESKIFDCDMKIWVNFDALNGSSIEVIWNLRLESNANIEWDLIVHWNLEVDSNLSVWGNLIVTWNISWENSNIDVVWYTTGNNIVIWANLNTQAIISTWYVSLWSNSSIERWIITDWYLMTWSNFDLDWISLIRWEFVTWSNFDGSWVLYVYGNFTWESNHSFDWIKLKVTDDFEIGSNWENNWRIFVYWTKKYWANYDSNKTNYGYLIWEIDPLLKYNLTKSEFNKIKDTTINIDKKVFNYKISAKEINDHISKLYESNENNSNLTLINKKIDELNRLKQKTITEFEQLFKYLDKHIENETFDINTYNELKENKLLNLNTFLNSMYWNNNNITVEKIYKKSTEVTKNEKKSDEESQLIQKENITEKKSIIKEKNVVVISKEKEKWKLSLSIINKLDNVLWIIDDRDFEKTYDRIIKKIDNMLEDDDEDLKVERNTLELIKEYLEKDLYERNIINQIFG